MTVLEAGVAGKLAQMVAGVTGGPLPVRLRAWDGSSTGPAGGPTLVIRDKVALRRLLWSPNELGLAQAYIAGEIDVEGDLAEGLRQVWQLARSRNLGGRSIRVPAAERLRAVRMAVRLGAFGPKPPAPSVQARLEGQVHSKERDKAAISYHYDLSNDFYALLLDPQMVYSCAYWMSDDPDYSLERAQYDKLDLICRKLGLAEGKRLLDVGCGWGALAVHAAQHHGAQVTGITLSEQQREYALKKVAELGLADRVEIRLQDYREVVGGPYDAISAIEMGEHVGAGQYPVFAARLHNMLAREGRLLIQQMSRTGHAPGGGAFIEHYVAPDMHMRPIGQTVGLLADAGLEIRDVHSLREHYVRTVRVWLDTLESRWDEVVALVGEPVARVWRLYLVGGALTFEEGRMGVDQILAVRPTDDGVSGMPAVRC
jgi:cyclopropane-fatty-acyl-phospholipid synthase